MKIGIAGPVATEAVAKYLVGSTEFLPQGIKGSPSLPTLIAALLERGHEVSVYTLDIGVSRLKRTVMASGPRFKLYIAPFRRHAFRPNGKQLGRAVDFFKVERDALREAIEDDKPDVVNAHWTYEFALAAIASGVPHVIVCRDSPTQILRFMPNLYRLARYFMARKVFREGRLFIANSDYLKEQIKHYTERHIKVIPNPAPLAFFEKPLMERTTSFDPVRPKIAMLLNGWQCRKNPKPALKAFSMMRRRVPGATLHLFGSDFGNGEKAQIWAKSHKLEAGIVFYGFTPHDTLLIELKNMHLLLHPALEESLGMCLVEAMALGLPVIGGDKSGAVPWVLDQGRAGLLTDVRSAEAIYQALMEAVKDKARYEELSRLGQERVRRVFSPSAVAEAYERMYGIARAAASGTV